MTPKTDADYLAEAMALAGRDMSMPKPGPYDPPQGGSSSGPHFDAGMAQRAYEASVEDQRATDLPMPGAAHAARVNVHITQPQDRPRLVRAGDGDGDDGGQASQPSEAESSPASPSAMGGEAQYEPSAEDPTAEFTDLDDDEEDGE